MGIGLVGCGRFGRMVLDACAELPHFRVAAVSDVVAERRAAAAERCGAVECADLGGLVALPDVQIVVIATPPQLHGSQALKAAQARKHLLVAEPLATQIGLADVLTRGMEREGQRLLPHLPLRTSPVFRLVGLLVKTAVMGAVTHFNVEHVLPGASVPEWGRKPEENAGVLVERGVHYFDLARWLLDAAPTSYAGAPHTNARHEMDGALINMSYSNGTIASYFFDWRPEVEAERSAVRIDFQGGSVVAEGWLPGALRVAGLPEETARRIVGVMGPDVTVTQAEQGLTIGFAAAGGPEGALRTLLNALGRAVALPDATLPFAATEAVESLRVALKAYAVVERKRQLGLS